MVQPQPMLRRLGPSFVVDVGANRGQFALDVLEAAPGARILSIEPLSSEAAVYRRVLGGRPECKLVECAAGSSAGQAVIHVSSRADSSSLLPIGHLQSSVFRRTAERRTESVVVRPLDELLADVMLPDRSMLKIDVQGTELDVLRGVDRRIHEFLWIYLEVSFMPFYVGQPLAGEVLEHLVSHDFTVVDLGRPVRRRGRTLQVDVLCERRGNGSRY
jgi:FkbM family methyltransferase